MRAVAARGKTVVFATHYLEEADTYADRIVLMARGRVVADGPPTEIKARVGGRTIRATLPGVDQSALASLPGVTKADQRGDALVLTCPDSPSSDSALRALLALYPRPATLKFVARDSRRRSWISPATMATFKTRPRTHEALLVSPFRTAAHHSQPSLR